MHKKFKKVDMIYRLIVLKSVNELISYFIFYGLLSEINLDDDDDD